MSRECVCRSGLRGREGRLRKNYTDYEDWAHHARMWGLHARLGYKSTMTAWRANPVIQWSVNPSDFRRAPRKSLAYT